MTDWLQCSSCEEEFRIVSDSGLAIGYCPFCGEEFEVLEPDDEDEWED
jgi:predicted RNA-binding Zn-ribbon protein involved in translation (DUF1610 family)